MKSLIVKTSNAYKAKHANVFHKCIFCKDVYEPNELQGLECPCCGDSIGWDSTIVLADNREEAKEIAFPEKYN